MILPNATKWSRLLLAFVLFIVTSPNAVALDSMRVAIVVNANSVDSLTIANHYASLRKIPDRCIIAMDGVPQDLVTTIDEFKAKILQPMIAELDKRGLGNQIDLIAYSADFPTAVRLDSDFARAPTPPNGVFTPVGSINGLTTLYQFLGDGSLNYIAPRTNFYARTDIVSMQQNPFLGTDRVAFDELVAEANKNNFAAAMTKLQSLLKKHPAQWPMRFRLATYQVRAGQTNDALETMSKMLRDRVAYRPMFELEKQFDSIRTNDVFTKLLAAMPAINPNRIPPLPFSARITWGQNGLPVGEGNGPRYLMSMVLAMTKGRGTTLDEAIGILTRAAGADATGEPATFFFSNSDDVRATTRFPLMPLAAVTLKQLGHEVIINKDALPKEQKKLMGAMLGSAQYDWPLSFNTLLPGSIAENLTSLTGVLYEDNFQTPMVELLRGGAAGTSGTVTEPYALQFKFPTPLIYPYYAAGTTLAEAFHLSVESPYQLLIMGDPLCRPYGDEHNEAFTLANVSSAGDAFSFQLKFWRPFKTATTKLDHIEIYFGGRLALASKPIEAVRINKAGLPPGWHEVTVVAVSNHPLRMSTTQSAYVLIGEEKTCPTIEASYTAPPDAKLTLSVTAPGASRIAVEHHGRRLIDTDEVSASHDIAIEKTGYGPVRLTPLAMRGDVWIPGKPIVINVPILVAKP